MLFGLKKEKELESLMKPFTAAAMYPGDTLRLRKNTRLFFDLYWQLLCLGYTEEQIADYALHICQASYVTKLPVEIAMTKAVFYLARQCDLKIQFFLKDDGSLRAA